MGKETSFYEARAMLLERVSVAETEAVTLKTCHNRVLGQDLEAVFQVPPFDRSPLDGYAFRAVDLCGASKEHPVTLRILEEIPAGGISHIPVTEGCAVKILTGAMIPEGADVVVKYEDTVFTGEQVTLFAPAKSGVNIVHAGEDVQKGQILANKGSVIDPGLAGTLAAQNVTKPIVYRRPKIGIISTGSELSEVGSALTPGKIYDTNSYMLGGVVERLGCEAVMFGLVRDSAEVICERIKEGLKSCDMVLLTGGVSVGDYDLTPAAMEMAGVKIFLRGVNLKPGMACAFGEKDGKLVCGLSGNPASSITNFYAIVMPAVKKLCGRKDYLPEEIKIRLLNGFKKKSPATRLLRGALEIKDGQAAIRISAEQGNVVLSSTIGCDVMAIIPAGSGAQEDGAELSGFMI